MRLGKFTQAESDLIQLLRSHPDLLQGWYLLADVSLKLKNNVQALDSAKNALRLAPEQPQVIILFSRCMLLNGQFREASNYALKLFHTRPNLLAKDWFQLGLCLYQVNQYGKALSCFQQAVQLEPNNGLYQYNLATSYRNCGDKKQAAKHLELALSLEPNNYDAKLTRSLLFKARDNKQHLADLESAVEQPNLPISGKIKLHFALAKEYEDLNHPGHNFHHLTLGNRLRAQHSRYQVKQDVDSLQQIVKTFSSSNSSWQQTLEKHLPVKSNITPIFITGLPRTGSTLLEQILMQHQKVSSAGELHNFGNCLSKAVSTLGYTPKNKNDFIRRCAELDMNEVGQDYISELTPFTSDYKMVIDKLPMNFLYTGLIQQVIPQAKIIHITRCPMATAYAIYKTYFEQAYPYAYRLKDIAHYYVAYRKLMKHWLKQNRHHLLLVNYEDLVTNPETTLQSVFDFLGLAFNPEFMKLNKTKTVSATASSAQVRDGIYTSSVQNWRHYEEQLTEFKDVLLAADIDPYAW